MCALGDVARTGMAILRLESKILETSSLITVLMSHPQEQHSNEN